MLDSETTVEGDKGKVGGDMLVQSLYELDVVSMYLRRLVKNLRHFQHERNSEEMHTSVFIGSRPNVRLRGRFDTFQVFVSLMFSIV